MELSKFTKLTQLNLNLKKYLKKMIFLKIIIIAGVGKIMKLAMKELKSLGLISQNWQI